MAKSPASVKMFLKSAPLSPSLNLTTASQSLPSVQVPLDNQTTFEVVANYTKSQL